MTSIRQGLYLICQEDVSRTVSLPVSQTDVFAASQYDLFPENNNPVRCTEILRHRGKTEGRAQIQNYDNAWARFPPTAPLQPRPWLSPRTRSGHTLTEAITDGSVVKLWFVSGIYTEQTNISFLPLQLPSQDAGKKGDNCSQTKNTTAFSAWPLRG